MTSVACRFSRAVLSLAVAGTGACGPPQNRAMRVRAEFHASDTLRYEFDWQRTFDPRIVVAISRQGAGYQATSVVYRLPTGLYDPEDLQAPVLTLDSALRPVSAAEWAAVDRALDAAGFWELPRERRDPGLSPGRRVSENDGADWVVRAIAGSRVHEVRRWAPVGGPDSLLAAAALHMIRVAGVQVDSDRVY